jgi:hypothetical protein
MKPVVQAREHAQLSKAENWGQQALFKKHTPGIFVHALVQKEFFLGQSIYSKFDQISTVFLTNFCLKISQQSKMLCFYILPPVLQSHAYLL